MRLLSEVRERVRALLFRWREERELDEELSFHVEMATEENLRRGMSREEARRQALIAFGGLDRIKEEVRDARGTRPLEDLARDLRFAVRRLAREPGFTIPTMATIALGIGVCTAVFVLVNAVLLRPLPYPAADRLVDIGHAAPRAELMVTGLSAGTFLHYRENSRAFEAMGTYLEDFRALTDLEAPEQVRIALVSPGLFTVLHATPYLGRFPVAADAEASGRGGVLISYDLWVGRYGADPAMVGRTIEIDRRPEVVVGVAQPVFHFPHHETQLWIGWPPEKLFARFGGPRADVRGLFLSGVGRLRGGVSRAEAERDLDRLVRTLPDVYPDVTAEQLEKMGLHAAVTPLKETVVGNVRAALLLLLGTAGFLLLVTWANATNLYLVRAERQRRAVVVERSLGATSGRLARRFTCESLLLVAIGGALGLALAHVAVELRFGFEPEQIPRLREVTLDRAGLGLAAGLCLLTGVFLAAVSLQSALRPGHAALLAGGIGRMTAGRKEGTTRRILVVTQVALACTLLIGSALMARSYWRLKQVDLGFEPERALTFLLSVPSDPYSDYPAAARLHDELLGRLRDLPGVEAAEAATLSTFPLTPVPDYYNDRVAALDRAFTDSAAAPDAVIGLATPGYFRAMGIPMRQGRGFQAIDAGGDAPGVILSAALARSLFGAEDPTGRRVRLTSTGDLAYTVIGMVGDVPSRAIDEGPARAVYFPNLYPARVDTATSAVPAYTPRDEQYIVRTSLPPTSLVAAIRHTIHEVDPKLVMMRVTTLEELVADSMARPRLTMLLLFAGAATALLLGVIGIYGVLSYAVRRRSSELGVRIALGASPARMARMVVRQSALLALGGIAVGLIAAFALTRFLRALLYEVSPSDPVAFLAVAVLIFAVALAASYLPARRAGRIDPVRALKAE